MVESNWLLTQNRIWPVKGSDLKQGSGSSFFNPKACPSPLKLNPILYWVQAGRPPHQGFYFLGRPNFFKLMFHPPHHLVIYIGEEKSKNKLFLQRSKSFELMLCTSIPLYCNYVGDKKIFLQRSKSFKFLFVTPVKGDETKSPHIHGKAAHSNREESCTCRKKAHTSGKGARTSEKR